MSDEISAAAAAGAVYRVARAPDAWVWPDWSHAGPDGRFRNRYDDPLGEYRVLYASSERLGALLEALAPFRADLRIVEERQRLDEAGRESAEPGALPASWLAGRVIGRATLGGPFAEIGHAGSLAVLRRHLAGSALHHGLAEIDAATIRMRAPRGFTQDVSRFIYECLDGSGAPRFAGIRYGSRLGDEIVNWAIFERPTQGLPIDDPASQQIERDDPDLLAALEHLELELV